MKPEYTMVAKGGLPNVDQAAIRRLVQRTLIVQANEAGIGAKNSAYAGEVIYHYDVTGAKDSGAWYERATVAPTSEWGFKLAKVSVRLPAGDGRGRPAPTLRQAAAVEDEDEQAPRHHSGR